MKKKYFNISSAENFTQSAKRQLEVLEYCEGQNLAKCYDEGLWKCNLAPGPCIHTIVLH